MAFDLPINGENCWFEACFKGRGVRVGGGPFDQCKPRATLDCKRRNGVSKITTGVISTLLSYLGTPIHSDVKGCFGFSFEI